MDVHRQRAAKVVPPSLAGDGDGVAPEPLAPEVVADEPSELDPSELATLAANLTIDSRGGAEKAQTADQPVPGVVANILFPPVPPPTTTAPVTAAAATATQLDEARSGSTALSPPRQKAPLHELLENVDHADACGNTPPRDASPTPATPETPTLATIKEHVQDAPTETVGKTAARDALNEKVETEARVRVEAQVLDLEKTMKKLRAELKRKQQARADEADSSRAEIEAILDQQQTALADVDARAADRLARCEAEAENRVARAEATIRDVEQKARHWTMTAEEHCKAMEAKAEDHVARCEAEAEKRVADVEQRARAWIMAVETGYKDRVRAAAEQFKAENSAILSRLEAMEKQLQGRGGAGGAVPLGDSNSKLNSSA